MELKFDLHVHSKLSKEIPFRLEDFHKTLRQAKCVGLNGFALTEHIHASDYWDIYEMFERNFLFSKGIYCPVKDFYVLNGAEITLKLGGDIIAIGDISSIRKLDDRLGLNGDYHPTPKEFFDSCPDDIFLVGAHPFRPEGGIVKYLLGDISNLQAFEINGKDFGLESRVMDLAKKFQKPLVGGSDAHYWPQVGIRKTVIEVDRVKLGAIIEQLRKGATGIESRKEGPLMVKISESYKRLFKEGLEKTFYTQSLN
jgi:hypothetical protein